MTNQMKKWGYISMILCCMGMTFGCASNQEPRQAFTDENLETDAPKVITACATDESKPSEQKIPAQYTDDWSALKQASQSDHSYAYQDGKVYFRQYHADSFEEGAVWGHYAPIAGTTKEMVCIDADGQMTTLFSDQGFGDFYLIGSRFYMMEKHITYENDVKRVRDRLYSVDMQGEHRSEYGEGEICAVDLDRAILILKLFSEETGEAVYNVLDCKQDTLTEIAHDPSNELIFWEYQDGWCYFDRHTEEVCHVTAISLDGAYNEIAALAPSEAALEYGYNEDLWGMKVAGDRIYMKYGSYAGSAAMYQDGRIITTKLDGTDYRGIECGADCFMVCSEAGRPLVYFPECVADNGDPYATGVWDLENNIIAASDFPYQLIYEYQEQHVPVYRKEDRSYLMCERNGAFYGVFSDSAQIVRLADEMNQEIGQRAEVDWQWEQAPFSYHHLYYADGFLYFEVEMNRYDDTYAVGWRDGYRRVQTNLYRRNLSDGTMELLYTY